MSRPRTQTHKLRKSRSKSPRKHRKAHSNMGNIVTSRTTNQIYPTGGKTHVKSNVKRHINPIGKGITITNSYMNKKGIVRHTKTKNIHPYVAPSLTSIL